MSESISSITAMCCEEIVTKKRPLSPQEDNETPSKIRKLSKTEEGIESKQAEPEKTDNIKASCQTSDQSPKQTSFNTDLKKEVKCDNASTSTTNSSSKLITSSILSVLNITAPAELSAVDSNIISTNDRNIFHGLCVKCEKTLEGRNPLILGCLHVYCSQCILRRQHFRLSSSLPNVNKGNLQEGRIRASVQTSFEKFTDVSSIPDEVFQSIENLKQYISNNIEHVGRLVVKCIVCECNTRAKVISKNLFVSKTSNDDASENISEVKVEKLCTNCEENSPAVRFCKDCNEHLCEECVSAHKRVKITKEHVLTILQGSEINNVSVNSSTTRRCKKHINEEIKVFCETCSMLTCRDCQLEFHRDHKYLFVSEAAVGQAKILETMQSKLNEKKFFLDQTTDTISTRLNTLFTCRDKANEDIIAFHKQLLEGVTAKCQFFLDKVHEITSIRHTKLTNQLHATKRLTSAVEHCVKFIDFAVEKQNSLALLDAKQMMLEYITTVMRQKFTTNPVAPSEIVFMPDNNAAKVVTMKVGSLLWGQPASSAVNHIQHQQQNKARKSHIQFPTSTSMKSSPTRANISSHFSSGAIHYRPAHPKNVMSTTPSSAQNRVMSTSGPPLPAAPMMQSTSSHMPSQSAELPNGNYAQNVTPNLTHYLSQSQPQNIKTQPAQRQPHHSNQYYPSPQQQQLLQQQQQLHQQLKQQRAHMIQQQSQQPQQNPRFARTSQNPHQFVSRPSPTTHQMIDLNSRMNPDPVRRSAASEDGMAIPTVRPQLSELKPFVTRVNSVPEQSKQRPAHRPVGPMQQLEAAFSKPSTPNDFQKILKSHSPSFVPSVPDAIGQERPRGSSLSPALPLADARLRPVVPEKNPEHPTLSGLLKSTRNSVHTQDVNPDNPGSISSADSGFGGGPAKLNETQWSAVKLGDFSLSPPALFDLTDIVKIDEDFEVEADANMRTKAVVVKEEKIDEPVDLEKELSFLAEEQKKEKQVPMKRELSSSDQESPSVVSSVGEESSHSEEEKKNLCDDNSLERKYDPNEDWCAVCNNGGDLLCCDTCPKVYHYQCHLPEIVSAPPGTWQCTLCRDIDKFLESESKYPKRKRVVGLQGRDLKICEKLTLELYCHPKSIPFHHAVRASVPHYYRVIKNPMDLSKVKKKLLTANFLHYENVKDFLNDLQQMFTNCLQFNGDSSKLGKMGKKLQKFFIELVNERLPNFSDYVNDLMKKQLTYLEENKLDLTKFAEENPPKPATAPSRVSSDKNKTLPYESDTLWQPDEEDVEEEEELESLAVTSEPTSEEELPDSDQELLEGSVKLEKRRKQNKEEIFHIK